MGDNFSALSERAEGLIETHEVNKENHQRAYRKYEEKSEQSVMAEQELANAEAEYDAAVRARNSAASSAYSDDDQANLASYDAAISAASRQIRHARVNLRVSLEELREATLEYNEASNRLNESGREMNSLGSDVRSVADMYREKSMYVAQLISMKGGENAVELVNHFKGKRKDAMQLLNRILLSLGMGEVDFSDDSVDESGNPVLVKKLVRSRGRTLSSAIADEDGPSFGGSSFSRASGISRVSNVLMNMLPQGARGHVAAAFQSAPSSIINEVNNVANGFVSNIAESGYGPDENGNWVKYGSYYDPNTRAICMNEKTSREEYAAVFLHEIMHAVDHRRGNESISSSFKSSVCADASIYDKNTQAGASRMQEMLDEAFESGAADDRYISDIMSAMFINDSAVVGRYYNECTSYYQHDNKYWAVPGNREAEIYANLGAIMTSQNRTSVQFVEKWFPSVTSNFEKRFDLL